MNRNILGTIRKSAIFKGLAAFSALNLVAQIAFPSMSWALTSGPAQEEYASFEPVGTNQMVDPYTGDFTYNLPLMTVPGPNGGYPINLAYHSGIGMEQEASWVGLGWNINVGAINRQMRGLPDDFKGDVVEQKYMMKDNVTTSVDIPTGAPGELFGFSTGSGSAGADFQVYYNNYRGVGHRISSSTSILASDFGTSLTGGLNASLGLAYDSGEGLDVSPQLSMSGQYGAKNAGGLGLQAGATYNSRRGLESFNFGANISATVNGKVGNGKNVGGATGSLSSSISFPLSHYVPQVSIPMTHHVTPFEARYSNNVAGLGNVTYGPWTFIHGSKSVQEVSNNGEGEAAAYGFLHTHEANDEDMQDFNRRPIAYSKKVPNLAPSSYTYDIFNISGQGTGGMFRPYRPDVSRLSDARVSSITEGRRENLEVGITGTTHHYGYGYTNIDGESSSGAWQDGQDIIGDKLAQDAQNATADPRHERSYFRLVGEKAAAHVDDGSSEYMLDQWLGELPLRAEVEKVGSSNNFRYQTTDRFVNSAIAAPTQVYDVNDATAVNVQSDRAKRATNIDYLTQTEAQQYGHSRFVQFEAGNGLENKFANVNSSYDDHISEVNVYQPNGMIYSYGLPAYNVEQKGVSFRIDDDPETVVDQQGLHERNWSLATFSDDGTDPIPGTGVGDPGDPRELDGYLSSQSVPGYAHSWLLTAIFSADYVDLTGDGPSDDDLGYWVQFDYLKAASGYKWRAPFTDAAYNPGQIGDETDNMGNYTFGKKELYYLNSVETKTHKAVFEKDFRHDGFEVEDEFSSQDDANFLGNVSLMKLNSIKLFSKEEIGGANPIPYHTVHFEYDYSLCPNTKNNDLQPETVNSVNINMNKGKLTLKKVWSTYEANTRGALTPYEFTYSSNNPDYNLRAMDRWGVYKNVGLYNPLYPTNLFPYTDQGVADQSDAWHLTQVKLPSGATLEVEYERDDYAYVENHKPMQMFDLRALGDLVDDIDVSGRNDGSIVTGWTNDKLLPSYSKAHVYGDEGNFRMYFELDQPFTGVDDKQFVLDNYLTDADGTHLTKMYFDVEIDLLNYNLSIPFTGPATFEHVSGYADVLTSETGNADFFGVDATGNYGYITVRSVPRSHINLAGKFIHPFQKAAFQHLQVNRPDLVYPSIGSPNNIVNLLGAATDVLIIAGGFNRHCYNRGPASDPYASQVNLNGRSIIRLFSPIDGETKTGKLGGGVRVKRIAMVENTFSGGVDQYGQVYDYTIEENGKRISSGVAYEPVIGGHENVLRQPIGYQKSTPLKSPHSMFIEEPLLEDYYPGAQVGYRKVTVSTLGRAEYMDDTYTESAIDKQSHKTALPVTEYQFFTGKEFPVVGNQTDLSNDRSVVRISFIPGFSSEFRKEKVRTQGYSIVLNDMAGKIRKRRSYVPKNPTNLNSVERTISSTEYIYRTQDEFNDATVNHLNNIVKVVDRNGQCLDAVMGETFDIFTDYNENRSTSESAGWDFNLELETSVPLPIPVPIPHTSETELIFKTAVTQKVIYKTGIIKAIETYDGQALTRAENLQFDAETGEAVVTQLTNEFDDPVYAVNFKGHWYYDGLQSNYQNQSMGMLLTTTPISANGTDGYIDFSGTAFNTTDYFTEGDELMVDNDPNQVLTVTEVWGSPNRIRCIKEDGSYADQQGMERLKVIRSGHRNLTSVNVGSIAALKDDQGLDFGPDGNSCANWKGFDQLEGILQASAITVSDEWAVSCGDFCGSSTTGQVNPYRTGGKGIWRAHQSYAFLEGRTQVGDIRQDGTFNIFVPFAWNGSINNRWKLASEVTKYNPAGYEIENRSALGVYSAAQYGYGNSLVTAVGANTQYREMLFDGFEDYALANCQDHHWDLVNNLSVGEVTNTEAHTGSSSVKVPPGATQSLTVNLTDVTATELYPYGPNGMENTDLACNGVFNPERDEDYWVSVWVKQSVKADPYDVSYDNPKLEVVGNTGGQSTLSTLTPSGNIIDGWQKMQGKVNIASNVTSIQLNFRNLGATSGADVYFDDFRICPADGDMVTYVYDIDKLKPVATLGANNYATFYIYDAEGNLVKTKIETEEGIKTVSEGRSSLPQ